MNKLNLLQKLYKYVLILEAVNFYRNKSLSSTCLRGIYVLPMTLIGCDFLLTLKLILFSIFLQYEMFYYKTRFFDRTNNIYFC